MVTENEIRNQIAIATSSLEKWNNFSSYQTKFINDFNKFCKCKGYIAGLKYVLGEAKAKYNKEDI